MTTPVCENRAQVFEHLDSVVAEIRRRIEAGTLRVIALTLVSNDPDNEGTVKMRHWVEGTSREALAASAYFEDFIHETCKDESND